ncbi:MAG: hypothetical protein KatS3mg011_0529 [Acidimicrobiia bacterium]|nr:MAG: hypothetical protein KatS3mg011_0529 [Acidimicrobiia bacterium]
MAALLIRVGMGGFGCGVVWAGWARWRRRCGGGSGAGLTIRQVTVDGGPEFKAAIRAARERLGIHRHQLPPRPPDLNAFVEDFQGTCRDQH